MDGMLEFSFAKASLQNFVTCQNIFVKKKKQKQKEVPKLLAQGILFCLNRFDQVYIWRIPLVDDSITHKRN
jgi:hypothetical protein